MKLYHRKENIMPKKKRRRQKTHVISNMIIIILAVAVVYLGNVVFKQYQDYRNRKSYTTVEEMRADLQGIWVEYDVFGSPSSFITIDGDKASEPILDQALTGEITWHPKEGTFEFYGEYVVAKDGNSISPKLSSGKLGVPYIRAGSQPTPTVFTINTPRPTSSAKTDLAFSGIKLSNNSSYTVCTGSVTNNGTTTYRYVKVRAAFKDKSGSTLDTDWTYAVGTEGLKPGESTTFSMSVPKNIRIETCSVELLDWN